VKHVTLKKNSRKPKKTKVQTRKPKKTKVQTRKPKKTKVQTKLIPLDEALLAAPNAMALASEPTVDYVLHQWLSQSVPGEPIPNVDQLQVAWKDLGSGGLFSVQVQQKLANLLNDAYSLDPQLVPANLPGTLTVGQLKLNLHRSA
jgi:hypothetical protein